VAELVLVAAAGAADAWRTAVCGVLPGLVLVPPGVVGAAAVAGGPCCADWQAGVPAAAGLLGAAAGLLLHCLLGLKPLAGLVPSLPR